MDNVGENECKINWGILAFDSIALFNMISSLCTMYIPCLIFSPFVTSLLIPFYSCMLGESTLRGASSGKKMYYLENKFNIILGLGFLFSFYLAFWVQ
jgi:hypothetical protein